MKNLSISLLLVLMVALQSFVAVADSDNNHQIDLQHFQTEHSHDTDNRLLFADALESEHSIDDCHHCGHCQGSHTQWVASKKLDQAMPHFLITDQYFYLEHLDKRFIEELIRPPIA